MQPDQDWLPPLPPPHAWPRQPRPHSPLQPRCLSAAQTHCPCRQTMPARPSTRCSPDRATSRCLPCRQPWRHGSCLRVFSLLHQRAPCTRLRSGPSTSPACHRPPSCTLRGHCACRWSSRSRHLWWGWGHRPCSSRPRHAQRPARPVHRGRRDPPACSLCRAVQKLPHAPQESIGHHEMSAEALQDATLSVRAPLLWPRALLSPCCCCRSPLSHHPWPQELPKVHTS